jgi:hypothetical protein
MTWVSNMNFWLHYTVTEWGHSCHDISYIGSKILDVLASFVTHRTVREGFFAVHVVSFFFSVVDLGVEEEPHNKSPVKCILL